MEAQFGVASYTRIIISTRIVSLQFLEKNFRPSVLYRDDVCPLGGPVAKGQCSNEARERQTHRTAS